MKRIVLFCAAGMSTGILVNNMKKAAEAEGKEFSINAYSLSEADTFGPDADVILVGPQVRYALSSIQEKFPDKPIEAIDIQAYGLMKGDVVLKRAIELMGEES